MLLTLLHMWNILQKEVKKCLKLCNYNNSYKTEFIPTLNTRVYGYCTGNRNARTIHCFLTAKFPQISEFFSFFGGKTEISKIYWNLSVIGDYTNSFTRGVMRNIILLNYMSVCDHTREERLCEEVKFPNLPNLIPCLHSLLCFMHVFIPEYINSKTKTDD